MDRQQAVENVANAIFGDRLLHHCILLLRVDVVVRMVPLEPALAAHVAKRRDRMKRAGSCRWRRSTPRFVVAGERGLEAIGCVITWIEALHRHPGCR